MNILLYSQNVHYYTCSLRKINVAGDFCITGCSSGITAVKKVGKSDLNTDPSSCSLNTYLLDTLGQYWAKFTDSSSSSHSSTLHNFLDCHLKRALVLAISKSNETINRRLSTIFIDGYFWASNTQVRPVSRILCGSISKAVYFWVRRNSFWETLWFWAPVDFLQLLPRHYVVHIYFIHFVYVIQDVHLKWRVRRMELGRGYCSSPGKQLSRLQGERERDCTAKSKEQKQGPASRVTERDTWDPEANAQRLQHFWKALDWQPVYRMHWAVWNAVFISSIPCYLKVLRVCLVTLSFLSFKIFYFIFWWNLDFQYKYFLAFCGFSQ